MVWRDKNHTLFNVPTLWLFLMMEVRGKNQAENWEPRRLRLTVSISTE